MLQEVLPRLVLGGRYKLIRLIGRGGVGSVYEAMDVRLERRVAVKRLNALATEDPGVTRRFGREALVTAKLRGPGILEVYDFDIDQDGIPSLVMEFLKGSDLSNELAVRGIPFSIGETVELGRQVSTTLGAAHDASIVHRDLKPSNVFLAQDGERVCAKVLDFGISKLVNRQDSHDDFASTKTGTVIGSPRYMSPEQIEGSNAVDPRSDIFSLGAILYELLTLEAPFSAGSLAGLALQILQQPHTPLSSKRPDIPPALERVVDRCLEKDPRNRYQSAHELRSELDAIAKRLDSQVLSLRIHNGTSHAQSLSSNDELQTARGPSPTGSITRLEQAGAPSGFFRADYFSESLYFENAAARHKRIEDTLTFYRDELHREYQQFDRQASQTHKLWLACVLLGFGVMLGGVVAMLCGLTTQGALTTASSVMLYFLQRTFQRREDFYRAKADSKHEHLRYGELWLLAVQSIDALSDPKARNAQAERLGEEVLRKMRPHGAA